MKKKILISVLFLFLLQNICSARTVKEHILNIIKELSYTPLSVLKGIFLYSVENVKKAYNYEVYQREKPEKRGKLRYKLFAIWRSIGEVGKGVIDGFKESVIHTTRALKELISIFFSD